MTYIVKQTRELLFNFQQIKMKFLSFLIFAGVIALSFAKANKAPAGDDVYCETDDDCIDAGDWQMGYYCCYGNNKCCPNAVFCDCPAEVDVILKYSEKLSKH